VKPALHLIVELEEPVEARVVAFTFGDEVRLADDVLARPRLLGEVRDALEDALETLRQRREMATRGDLAA
jgi:hypothetical protein